VHELALCFEMLLCLALVLVLPGLHGQRLRLLASLHGLFVVPLLLLQLKVLLLLLLLHLLLLLL
jgi:hypothetical protein